MQGSTLGKLIWCPAEEQFGEGFGELKFPVQAVIRRSHSVQDRVGTDTEAQQEKCPFTEGLSRNGGFVLQKRGKISR